MYFSHLCFSFFNLRNWVSIKIVTKDTQFFNWYQVPFFSSTIFVVKIPDMHSQSSSRVQVSDPIPDFADAEVEKFRTHLLNKLYKREMYEDSVEEVVEICTEIFSTFLHTEYGGPGTLLVEPFIDMSDALNEQGLPGGPQAARAAIKWATKHVDKDWKEWTGDEN